MTSVLFVYKMLTLASGVIRKVRLSNETREALKQMPMSVATASFEGDVIGIGIPRTAPFSEGNQEILFAKCVRLLKLTLNDVYGLLLKDE